ncbi:thiolase family protein [Streptomyces sp. RS2]|uniref:thiolase family protein n=1 Tax=Streptomyces sp. RS2 TaxID=1451205 RepID=UPI0021F8FBB9|nr:thiolase family protein [Streptomyces sp. RS2]MCW1100243.1 thiolase family protein [Streptomyces sp. RS2]
MSHEVYLIGGVRTPQGRYGGLLASVRPDDLAALVVGESVVRCGVPPHAVDEVILGAANQSGEDNRNVARMAVLLAGLPDTVPGHTVNRLCASGLTAVASAAQAIRSGEADLVVAGGVESMTRAPWVMDKPGTPWAKPGAIHDTSLGWRFVNPHFEATDRTMVAAAGSGAPKIAMSMGETAEEVAALAGITRAESDTFALRSHKRAVAAQSAGHFNSEIVPVRTRDGEVSLDEGPRPSTSLAQLGKLRTIFRPGGIVTAGSSSPLSDGAAAVVVANQEAVERYRLTPKARIVTSAAAGVQPHLMGLGPVPATRKALTRANWQTSDLDTIEINEAFAAQTLAVIRRLELDEEKVNASGGAIALGHPLGCSGARILITLMGRMEREDTHRGLVSLCVGVGQGVAMLVERM